MAKSKKVSSKLKSGKTRGASRSKKAAKSKESKSRAKPKTGKATAKPGKATAKSAGAMRLTFSYKGDAVKLVSQQPVDMTVPPTDSVKGFKGDKGFWAELKNAQDKTLYRRVMHNPTRNDAEVFSDDPEQGISREPAPQRTGVFVVVVPNTEKGHEVTLSRSTRPASTGPGGPRKGMAKIRSLATGPAEEIARFKLKK